VAEKNERDGERNIRDPALALGG